MKRFFKVIFFCFLALFVLCGCKKNKNSKKTVEIEDILPKEAGQTAHKWFYFLADGFAQIDKPRNAPFSGSIPYTEALRISAANNAAGSNGPFGNKAFALVNRLGVLCFEGDTISIAKDVAIFSERTAGNMVFIDDEVVFSVYKSAFFNDTIDSELYKKNPLEHLFLIHFDDTSKISYPLLNCANLTSENDSEVTDFFWDGTNWFCSLKRMAGPDGRTAFSYIKFHPMGQLLSVSPVSAGDALAIQSSDVSEFRNAMSVRDYSKAPERIKKMLAGFADTVPFIIEVKSAGGSSPRIYENLPQGSFEQELNAKAIISQSWSAALFEDGTLFLEGALPGKHILRGGKAVAVRLPKLDKGYVYSDFVISGTVLYAAWEETDFYKINRSGFLSVDLDSTLYSRIR